MTDDEAEQEAVHRTLWGNVQTVRDVMRGLAQTAAANGDDTECQARIFIENKLLEIQYGASFDILWDELELLYRKITAGAVEMMLQEQHEAGKAFVGSAGMLLGLLKPELSDEERNELFERSLDNRMAERGAE